jgi:hypothetical protein
MANQGMNIEEEAKTLVSLIIRELVTGFGKSDLEAGRFVNKARVFQSLIKNPLGLHESPHMWAISVLTENGDVEALEKYYDVH